MKVLVTGASGLLGRAMCEIFEAENCEVHGTAFSRVRAGLTQLDLTNDKQVHSMLKQLEPTAVVHCAAARFPDKVDADPDAALRLNVDATRSLCVAADAVGAVVLYISTDYVFDGTSPPYAVSDKPNPVNFYGKTKLQGEQVTLEVNPGNLVLRIPVLYGPVEKLSESAVTVLAEALLDTSQPRRLSDYEKRYPSHVNDISHICSGLLHRKLQDKSVAGIFHWSGKERLTKYEMVLQMAEVFGLPHSHIEADTSVPSSTSAPRPYDTMLDTSRLESLQLGTHTTFKVGIKDVLQPYITACRAMTSAV